MSRRDKHHSPTGTERALLQQGDWIDHAASASDAKDSKPDQDILQSAR